MTIINLAESQNLPFSCLPRLYFLLSAIVALHLSRVLYKSTLFLQNKPNLLNAEMNVSKAYTGGYENKCRREHPKNKPNSNPIKPNSNPIQTQFKANSKPIKPNLSLPKGDQTQFEAKTKPISKGPPILLCPALLSPMDSLRRTSFTAMTILKISAFSALCLPRPK